MDIYNIILNNLIIYLLINNQYENVCNEFDMNIKVNLPKNVQVFDEIYQ